MFCVVDRDNNFTPIKSGFKSFAQANNWAKKTLPKDEVHLWGDFADRGNKRYFVRRK